MIKRDFMGRLEYSVVNKNGDLFRVCRVRSGPYRILKVNHLYTSAARLLIGGWDIFGDNIGAFDSFIRACDFLRKNADMMV